MTDADRVVNPPFGRASALHPEVTVVETSRAPQTNNCEEDTDERSSIFKRKRPPHHLRNEVDPDDQCYRQCGKGDESGKPEYRSPIATRHSLVEIDASYRLAPVGRLNERVLGTDPFGASAMGRRSVSDATGSLVCSRSNLTGTGGGRGLVAFAELFPPAVL